MKHAFGAPVLYGSYRFMTDDWGIDSHTGEVRLRWPVGDANYVERRVEWVDRAEPRDGPLGWALHCHGVAV